MLHIEHNFSATIKTWLTQMTLSLKDLLGEGRRFRLKLTLVVCSYSMWRGIMSSVMSRTNTFWGPLLASSLIDALSNVLYDKIHYNIYPNSCTSVCKIDFSGTCIDLEFSNHWLTPVPASVSSWGLAPTHRTFWGGMCHPRPC